MAQIPVGPQYSQVWAGGAGTVLLANQDLVNTVTVGRNRDIAIGRSDGDLIPPLGSVTYSGGKPLYAIAPGGTAPLLAIPDGSGWAPSPSQIAAQISLTGASPGVPGITSVSGIALSAAGSPYTLETFGAKSRIWQAQLSLAAATDSAYAGGLAGINARLQTGSGIILAVAELAIGAAGESEAVMSSAALNGIAVAAGDTLQAIINGGISITDAFIRASALVLVSSP